MAEQKSRRGFAGMRPEQRRAIASMRAERLTLAEIGRRMGVCRQCVKSTLDRHGLAKQRGEKGEGK
jgi:DNA-directed RNA polymerase specialized sigma24 family protein